MVRLLACGPPAVAFKDERAEGGAIVRVHILNPARDAQVREYSLYLFGRMATWCGTRYIGVFWGGSTG